MKNLIKTAISVVVASVSMMSLLAQSSKPNVVFIITDDQGYGDLSVTGNPILKTPAMDALHDESVRLTDYHVSPTCAPTRGALMSGHYTNRAGPWHTIMGRSFLRPEATTFGEVFGDNGYATGMFGKWHLGDNYPYRPEDRGFTEVVRHGGGGVGQTPDYWDNSYFDDTYWHNGKPTKYEGYCTDVYFQEAKRFMEESIDSDKPFFTYISPNAPHSPFHCPDEFWKPYANKGISDKEAIFFGMIANIDHNLGELRKWLDKKGVSENTIFIFTTDNGSASGSQVFNDGMRGAKASEYDGGHHVPFFMHWPEGKLTKPKDVDTLTAHIDILPTLIELCGLNGPMDYSFDGRSLAPLIYDNPAPWPSRTIVTDSQRVRDPIKWRKSATMTDKWRLINGEELYNMESDPGQTQDVSAQYPEVMQSLRVDYDRWWASISPGFAKETPIIVGNDAENPASLTSHDWLTNDPLTPWHQSFIRGARQGDGFWSIRIDKTGTYEIALRRWPQEVSKPINAKMAPGAAVPGLTAFRETAGKSIGATSAVLEIGGQTLEKKVGNRDQEISFTVDLKEGLAELHGFFRTEGGKADVLGAYYAVVTRK
jgi:arylsulfatase B